MRRKAVCSLMMFMTVASLVVGCGGDSGPQSKPGEQPTSTETEKGKLKSGGGSKGK